MAKYFASSLLVCSSLMVIDTTIGSVCVTRLVGGTFSSLGNCDNVPKDKASIVRELEAMIESEKASTESTTIIPGATYSFSSDTNVEQTSDVVVSTESIATNEIVTSVSTAFSTSDTEGSTGEDDDILPSTTIANDVTDSNLPYGNVSDSCQIEDIGGCFWTSVNNQVNESGIGYRFWEGRAVCESHGSEVAVIPNEETYNAIIRSIRSKMPTSWTWTWVWVGMTINSTTGEIKPTNAFYRWFTRSGWPYLGPEYASRKNIAIAVERASAETGMINLLSGNNFRMSVACWKPPVNVSARDSDSDNDSSVGATTATVQPQPTAAVDQSSPEPVTHTTVDSTPAAFDNSTRTSCANVDLESAIMKNLTGGVYEIYLPNRERKMVYCDLSTDGGNWTVFQRRVNGDVDFYRGWDDYVNGFGNPQGDFWLGLETIHQLTQNGGIELRIDFIRNDGAHLFAKYSNFRIGSSEDKYRLSVSGYSGNATDSFSYEHEGKGFSTKDADNDRNPGESCATRWSGAWWYNTCNTVHSNLNGIFQKAAIDGVSWYDRDRSQWRFMDFAEMKLRAA